MKPRVLVIEDESTLIEIWLRLLNKSGCHADVVRSLAEGMAIMRRIPPPDYVVLDLRLADSFDATETVRVIPEIKSIHPSSSVIVTTGYSTNQIKELAMQLGADVFTDKNRMFHEDGCWGVLKRFIDKHKGTGRSGAEATMGFLERLSRPPQEDERCD